MIYPLSSVNSSLSKFMKKTELLKQVDELARECENVTTLIHQLQLPHINERQRSRILTELLAASIHLNQQCNADFQKLVAREIESLNG
ncbi:MAG: hypothetical protein HLUCCO16_13875 [Phormidium sp. OSCR]|nr:MAG: hypothetical protein HLUCCO16_13875 [Phormidium sp. OSCR]